jgi:hypothetical protein
LRNGRLTHRTQPLGEQSVLGFVSCGGEKLERYNWAPDQQIGLSGVPEVWRDLRMTLARPG